MNQKSDLLNKLLRINLPIFKISKGNETDLIIEIPKGIMVTNMFNSNRIIVFKGYILLDEKKHIAYYYEQILFEDKGIGGSDNNFSYEEYLISYKGLDNIDEISFKELRNRVELELSEIGWELKLVHTKKESTYDRYKMRIIEILVINVIIKQLPLIISFMLIILFLLNLVNNLKFRNSIFETVISGIIMCVIYKIYRSVSDYVK